VTNIITTVFVLSINLISGLFVHQRIRVGCDDCQCMCSGRSCRTILYLLVSTGNDRVKTNLDQNENDECDASGIEDEGSNENDRSHLLPVDVPMDDAT